jgi:hypothetical protein
MSTITVTQLYDKLSVQMGKETAGTLTAFIENKIKEDLDEKIKILATKEDISGLRLEMKQESASLRLEFAEFKSETKQEFGNVRSEMKQGFAEIRSEMKQGLADVRSEIAELRDELKTEIKDGKAAMLKWMFIYWTGTLGILLTIIFFFMKK